MKKFSILFVLLLLFNLHLSAQHSKPFYNFNNWSADTTLVDKFDYNFDVPTLLIGAGIAANLVDNNYHNVRKLYTPNFHQTYDDYIQFLPAAVLVGLKLGGVKGRSTWTEMLVADAFGMAMTAGLVQGIKYTAGKRRPDNTAYNAFPSGHTATSFMTATMLHKEYGHRSPWISIGAYTCATLAGITRQLNNRHWMSDVIAGAGIGILSVELGYLFSDLIFSGKNDNMRFFSPPETRYNAPSFVSINSSVKYHVNDYRLSSNDVLDISFGGSVAIEGAWYLNTFLGIGARLDAASYSYNIDDIIQADQLGLFTPSIGVYNSIPISSCLRIENKALAGYGFVEYENPTFPDENIDNNVNFTLGTSICYWARSNYSMKLFGEYTMMPNFISDKMGNEFSIGLSLSCMF